MASFDKEMWEDFVIEVKENLEEFEPNLLLLEQEPEDQAILNDCFRNMHSIKGAANYMGFENMASLAHKIENIMDRARSGKEPLNEQSFDLIFKAIDTIRSLLKDIEKNQKETLDIKELLNELSNFENREHPSTEDEQIDDKQDIESELEDKELLNIFQEEIKSLISQLEAFLEEKIISQRAILTVLGDMERVVNYMGKDELLSKLKELKEDIDLNKKDSLTNNELSEVIDKLVNIFKGEVNFEDKESKKDFSIQARFEEDEELYNIFLDFFKEVGKPLFSCPETFDPSWAQECQTAVEKLKNSANYMDYMDVVKIFEEWEECLAEALTTPNKYKSETFLSLWKKLEAILPGLSESFAQEKDLEAKDQEVQDQEVQEEDQVGSQMLEEDSLELFETAIDSILDGVKKPLQPEAELSFSSRDTSVASELTDEDREEDKTIQTVRVNLEKVENLLEDVAELVVLRSSMSRNTGILKELYNFCLEKRLLPTKQLRRFKEVLLGFSEDVSALERVVHQLQDGVMRIRMLPVSHLFNRFPRLVRNLSKNLEKEVELKIIGADTALDKQVMEQLSDPLLHIIRNAIDHGLEKPEERKLLGKPSKGQIILSASQEGNYVVIKITDDGRGIDKEAILNKALNLGLISKKEIAQLDDGQIYSFIFAPGVSTAGEVSEISGRGVGLDVVKRNIESIGGSIEVSSQKGFGTKIILRIPLTLAIIKGLVVKVGQQYMVIPVSTISETFRIADSDISQVEGYEIISRRQETLPLIQLRKIFRGTGKPSQQNRFFAVRVKLGELDACLGVDELVGQQEIVIKPLSDYLMEQPGFSGATILGDGSIALILDLPAVLEKAKGFVKKRQQFLEMQALGIGGDTSMILH